MKAPKVSAPPSWKRTDGHCWPSGSALSFRSRKDWRSRSRTKSSGLAQTGDRLRMRATIALSVKQAKPSAAGSTIHRGFRLGILQVVTAVTTGAAKRAWRSLATITSGGGSQRTRRLLQPRMRQRRAGPAGRTEHEGHGTCPPSGARDERLRRPTLFGLLEPCG